MAVLSEMRMPSADSFIRNTFEPMFQQELAEEGIKHECGLPYRVKWLDRDGAIFRSSPIDDTMEAVLTVCCEPCMSRHHPTAYNYGCIAISRHTLTRYQGNYLDLITHEVARLWSDLKEHLRNLGGAFGPGDKAVMAESLTRMLALKGSTTLSKVMEMFEIEDCWREEFGTFIGKLGFIRDPHWRVPVMPMPTSNFITDSSTLATMTRGYDTKFDVQIDPLLALPPDHPLASAA